MVLAIGHQLRLVKVGPQSALRLKSWRETVCRKSPLSRQRCSSPSSEWFARKTRNFLGSFILKETKACRGKHYPTPVVCWTSRFAHLKQFLGTSRFRRLKLCSYAAKAQAASKRLSQLGQVERSQNTEDGFQKIREVGVFGLSPLLFSPDQLEEQERRFAKSGFC